MPGVQEPGHINVDEAKLHGRVAAAIGFYLIKTGPVS
jgi:hypothetical protein